MLPGVFATRAQLDECFRACGAEPQIVSEMNAIAPMLGLVQRTRIGAIVARHAVPKESGLAIIPLESPTPIRTPGILRNHERNQTEQIRSFSAIVRGVALASGLT